MMYKAWCSVEEVPYNYFRSSIKFQGHPDWKIDDLNSIWVRLLGRSQLSNPLDLPCSFPNATFIRKEVIWLYAVCFDCLHFVQRVSHTFSEILLYFVVFEHYSTHKLCENRSIHKYTTQSFSYFCPCPCVIRWSTSGGFVIGCWPAAYNISDSRLPATIAGTAVNGRPKQSMTTDNVLIQARSWCTLVTGRTDGGLRSRWYLNSQVTCDGALHQMTHHVKPWFMLSYYVVGRWLGGLRGLHLWLLESYSSCVTHGPQVTFTG